MKHRNVWDGIVRSSCGLAVGWLSLALLGCNGESFYSPHAIHWNFYLFCDDCLQGYTIPVGQTRRLQVDTRTFSAGTVGAIGSLSCPQMIWSSSSPSVASVSGSGKIGWVTALSPGAV